MRRDLIDRQINARGLRLSGHVLDYEIRIARQVAAEMPHHRARKSVVTAAAARPDDEPDALAAVELYYNRDWPAAKHLMSSIHYAAVCVFMAVLALHVAAALWHWWRRDGVAERMGLPSLWPRP